MEATPPPDVTVKRDEGITLEFVDGLVAEFNLVEVRMNCPCAECHSLRSRGEDTWPRPNSPLPLRISDAEMHGAWGLMLTWNDGHSTGIYPFELLRDWAEQAV